jgi:hypothetical protein
VVGQAGAFPGQALVEHPRARDRAGDPGRAHRSPGPRG